MIDSLFTHGPASGDAPLRDRVIGARPLADEAALGASLVRASELGAACDSWMDAIEINPLKVLAIGQGAVALDAVVSARN